MRGCALFALVCCLFLACSKSEKKVVSVCETAPLKDLIAQHPVHVLCGAADVVAGAQGVCDSTFEEAWITSSPENLRERTSPAKVNAGIGQVCSLIDKLPAAGRAEATAGMVSWIDAWFAIEQTEDVSGSIEYFASAVALVPEVRAAIPDGVIERAPGHRPGDTMASAEFTMMSYELAHILFRMPTPERDRVLIEVRARAAELLKSDQRE